MEKVNFAIIGCGRIAQRHAEHINNNGKLVAVCDIDLEKAQQLAGKYNAKAYQNIDDLLQNETVDLVAICSPNGLHAEHSIKALNAGFHVLCEKPMAINVNDCGDMIKQRSLITKGCLLLNKTDTILLLQQLRKLLIKVFLGKYIVFN